jgi:hypothetical protein
MQRKDFILSLYCHSIRQLLLLVVKLIDKRAVAGSITRMIKVHADRGGPLNEAADALASAAAESDSVIPAEIELDPDNQSRDTLGRVLGWGRWHLHFKEASVPFPYKPFFFSEEWRFSSEN